ncbi:conserved serine-rich protein [Rutstroemia sp. NJR-2017a WRK4]|nr:conserved serine-rich protein [Rutstroemia sp. NJR-2017a WRK4]
MHPKEKHGGTESSRRNTLQRMLDLEKKNKLDRMQASSATIISSPTRDTYFREKIPTNPNVYSKPVDRPVPFRQAERAMTAPTLSVTIPPAQPMEPTKREPIKSKKVEEKAQPRADESPQLDGNESDASSICRSPTWGGGEGKQKKAAKQEAKEIRKKEEETMKKDKEKAEKESRAAVLKQKGRLSKQPPTNKRLSKAAAAVPPINRSSSEPAVQVSPEIPNSNTENTSGRRSRRTSLDVGIRNLLSSWRSSNGTRGTNSQSTSPTKTSPTKTGFIGGLRLQLADEAVLQKDIHITKPDQTNNSSANSANKVSRPPISLDHPRNRGLDLAPSPGSNSSAAVHSARSRSNDSFYSTNAKESQASPALTPELAMGKHNRTRKANNEQRTGRSEEPTSGKARSQTYDNPPSLGFDFGLEKAQTPMGGTQENPYFHNFDTSPQELASGDDGYFPSNQREYNAGGDRGQSRSEVPSKGRNSMQRTPSIHGAHGHSPNSGHMGTLPQINTHLPDEGQDYRIFMDGEYTPPDLKLSTQRSSNSIQPEEGLFSFRGKTSQGSSPSPLSSPYNGAKVVAVPAASRYSYQPVSSPPGANSPGVLSQEKAPRPHSTLSPPSSGFDSRNALPSQIRRMSAESQNRMAKAEASPPEVIPSSQMQYAREPVNPVPPRKQKKNRRSSSRSFTGSSEEYLSLDEQSNITTPNASRPQSSKGYFAGATSQENAVRGRNRDTSSKLAIHADAETDSDNNTTPTGHQTPAVAAPMNPHASRASVDPNTAEGVTDLQRRLSLSKSSSTTALQEDLNFLPTLKHQPLRPRQAKRPSSSSASTQKSKPESTYPQYNESKQSIVSSPALLENGHSSSSSGDGGQYLQNARLNMLGPRAAKGKGKFMDPTSSKTSLQSVHTQPIAKMFVICCGCKYYHDLPSKLYECMARPDNLVKDQDLGVSGLISTAVKCPWCGHGMTTKCCEGWAAVVSLREKLH